MSNPPTVSEMNDLYDHFGTHAIDSLSMGSKFVAEASFDKKVESRMKNESKSVSFNANIGGFGFSNDESSSRSVGSTSSESIE